MSKQLITNRAITMTLDDNGKGSASIYFPQTITRVSFKAIGYQPSASYNRYGYITSDLVGNQTIGLIYRNNATGISPFIDLDFKTPQISCINGIYNFQLYNLNGSLATQTNGDYVCVIMEFVSEFD